MHLEGDGILGAEGYQVMYMLIRKRGYFTLQEANHRIKGAPKSIWAPDGICIRPMHASVLKGQRGGKPLSDCRLRYTAAEVHKFAIASIGLFDDLVPEDEPVWLCWKKHVEYLHILLQSSFTSHDIVMLDKLIYDHQTMYNQASVPTSHCSLLVI